MPEIGYIGQLVDTDGRRERLAVAALLGFMHRGLVEEGKLCKGWVLPNDQRAGARRAHDVIGGQGGGGARGVGHLFFIDNGMVVCMGVPATEGNENISLSVERREAKLHCSVYLAPECEERRKRSFYFVTVVALLGGRKDGILHKSKHSIGRVQVDSYAKA